MPPQFAGLLGDGWQLTRDGLVGPTAVEDAARLAAGGAQPAWQGHQHTQEPSGKGSVSFAPPETYEEVNADIASSVGTSDAAPQPGRFGGQRLFAKAVSDVRVTAGQPSGGEGPAQRAARAERAREGRDIDKAPPSARAATQVTPLPVGTAARADAPPSARAIARADSQAPPSARGEAPEARRSSRACSLPPRSALVGPWALMKVKTYAPPAEEYLAYVPWDESKPNGDRSLKCLLCDKWVQDAVSHSGSWREPRGSKEHQRRLAYTDPHSFWYNRDVLQKRLQYHPDSVLHRPMPTHPYAAPQQEHLAWVPWSTDPGSDRWLKCLLCDKWVQDWKSHTGTFRNPEGSSKDHYRNIHNALPNTDWYKREVLAKRLFYHPELTIPQASTAQCQLALAPAAMPQCQLAIAPGACQALALAPALAAAHPPPGVPGMC